MSELLLDTAGRRRSPATLPHFHAGRPPRNKGIRYPADPPTIEEIIAVMRGAGDSVHGRRLRGLIVVLWRAGLRIHEALALTEADLDARRGWLLVRRGKAAAGARSGWTTGPGNSSRHGSTRASNCRSAVLRRQHAHADGRGRPPPPARSCAASPAPPACGDASRPISCGMPTPSRWCARACR
jgi:integrase